MSKVRMKFGTSREQTGLKRLVGRKEPGKGGLEPLPSPYNKLTLGRNHFSKIRDAEF